MIKTISGYNQAVAVELNLNVVDLRILLHMHIQVMCENYKVMKLESLSSNEFAYYGVTGFSIGAEIPMLYMCAKAIEIRLKRFQTQGLIDFHSPFESGDLMYFKFTKLYYEKLLHNPYEVV